MKALRKPYGKRPYSRTRFAKGYRARQLRRLVGVSAVAAAGFARVSALLAAPRQQGKQLAVATAALDTFMAVRAAAGAP